MSTLFISLDFEMFWGVADVRTVADYGAHVRGERLAIPAILDLFARYGIRATWATVGMLMCRDAAHWCAVTPSVLPGYARAGCSPYAMAETVRAYPELFFARDLVARVRDSEGQEVATHTYSHFYCGEPGATPEQFLADLACATEVGAELGLRFETLVFPRNQVLPAFLAVLSQAGIKAYRGNPQHVLYRDGDRVPGGLLGRAARLADAWLPLSGPHTARAAPQAGSGATALPASLFLRPSPRRAALAALDGLRLRRITAAMTAAARSGGDFHLWWHPHNFGVDTARNLALLESVLQHFRALQQRYGMRSASMADAVMADRA